MLIRFSETISKFCSALHADIAKFFGFNSAHILRSNATDQNEKANVVANEENTTSLSQAFKILADALETHWIPGSAEILQQEAIKLVHHLASSHDTILLLSAELNTLTSLLKQIKQYELVTTQGQLWADAVKPSVQLFINSYHLALTQKYDPSLDIDPSTYANPLRHSH